MKPAFGKKSFYSKSNRHQNECYSTVIDKKPGSDSIAYMEVNGKRESLVYRKCLDSPATG